MKFRTEKPLGVGIAVLTALAIGYAFYLSFDSESYFFYFDEDRINWTSDIESVSLVAAFILGAGALAIAAIIAPRPRFLGARCGLALTILVPWALYTSQFVIHAPKNVVLHLLWVWLLVIFLTIAAVASCGSYLIWMRRGKRTDAT